MSFMNNGMGQNRAEGRGQKLVERIKNQGVSKWQGDWFLTWYLT